MSDSLDELRRSLFAAVLSDCLDAAGHRSQAMQADVIAAALAKVRGESETRAALERGEKLADVFRRHGIL